MQAQGKPTADGLRRHQQSLELARQNVVVSLDGDQFRSRTCTSYTLHGAGANAEGIGEQGAHFVGGCAIDGSGPHAHL